jgi:hypothetical protein
MHAWRTHSAWLLLALLTLGGVVAPAVHQAQHGEAHARVTIATDLERRPHSEFDHTMRADTEPSTMHAFQCLLCHTQLVSELGRQIATPTPHPNTATLGITSLFVRAVSHLAPSLIRGPPAVA